MKKLKKGFTLVELLVVIAILAILATVGIISYTSFIKDANVSNDEVMIAQMNKTIQADAVNNKHNYAGDAIDALNRNGFLGKYNTFTAGYHYGYSKETDKMYLIDDTGAVIYPEKSNVQLSDLWCIWQNGATDKVDGVNKYVSLVNITGNGGYLPTQFASGSYTIDLDGHFINYTGTALNNVTVINGVFISGAKTSGSEIVQLSTGEKTDIVAGTSTNKTVIENKVFDCSDATISAAINAANVTYKNCYFYNSNESGSKLNNRTFENCTFVDSVKYIFNLQGDGIYDGTLTVKNCQFINCARVFNMPIGVYGQSVDGKIVVTGNTFYGIVGKDRSICQLMTQKATSSTTLHYLDITFSNNTFVECTDIQAGLFTLYDNTQTGTINADHITFTNNTVDSSIKASKYFVNDDGKDNSLVAGYDSTFKDALTAKFKASIK